MIASWRGLGVLAAVAVLLAAALVIDLARTHAPPDRRLVHVDVAKVSELAWDGTRVVRAGDAWKQGDVILDPAAVGDVLRTLEAATWHRRGERFAGAHHTLVVAGTKIELGDDLAGTAQTWLRVDGTVRLVDTWIANALFPDPLALRVRHPFAAAARADHLHVRGDKVDVELVGHPRRLGEHGPLADAVAVHSLEAALADAEVVALAGGVWKGPFVVALDGATTEVGYACGSDRMALEGPYGSTCIATEAWQRVLAAAAAVGIDGRPVIAAPRKIQLDDGNEVMAHDASAAGLVHALVTPGTPVGPFKPGTKGLATLIVDAEVVAVFPDDLVLRQLDGELIRIAHDDWLALQKPASAWADPTRWSEDPSAVTTIAIDHVTYRRGAVLGEWSPPKDLEALAAALAHVQARDGAAAPTQHTITVTLAPPVGTPVTHTLAVGARCAGTIDNQPVAFEPATCHALEGAVH